MNNNDGKFTYSYSAPTESERREIDGIRRRYIAQEPTKLERLKRLDARVNNPPKIVAAVMGVAGVLIFGSGLAMILEWSIYVWGAVVAAVGLAPAIGAYFAYKSLLRNRKQKYGEEILRLSDELLGESGKKE